MQLEQLDTALDDLEGLLEAHRALGDDGRSSALRRNPELLKQLQRELADAADAYMATLIASSSGELSAKRITTCRQDALALMKTAVARRTELASLVNQQRLPAAEAREDLKQLVTLSLHCRAAVAALTPTVDSRAADALANKVLVELREATLRYAASARDGGAADTARPRAAAVDLLEKAEQHAAELVRLAPDAPEAEASLGVVLSKDVNAMLHKTAIDWETARQA